MSLIALIIKRHDTPTNYYLLATFVSHSSRHEVFPVLPLLVQTVMESLSLGAVVMYFDLDLVIKAFVITVAVFLALTVYTMQSKYDFSTWGARLATPPPTTPIECLFSLQLVLFAVDPAVC